jgi:hypothetical protein
MDAGSGGAHELQLTNDHGNAQGEMGRRARRGANVAGREQPGDHEGRPYDGRAWQSASQHSRGDGLSSPRVGPGKGDHRVAIAFADKVLYGRPLWVAWRGWFVDARAAPRPRATIKAHPATPYRPRPYGGLVFGR